MLTNEELADLETYYARSETTRAQSAYLAIQELRLARRQLSILLPCVEQFADSDNWRCVDLFDEELLAECWRGSRSAQGDAIAAIGACQDIFAEAEKP